MTDQENGQPRIRRMTGGPNIPYANDRLMRSSPEQERKARLACADHARNVEDLRDLLWVLGLLP